jgi:hypothetical protein
MSTLTTIHSNEDEDIQKAILKSWHKAMLVEKAKQENKIKPKLINKYRFMINHADNMYNKEVITILQKCGCSGTYEKRHDRQGVIVTQNVSQDLLDSLNRKLLQYGINVEPYYSRKRKKSKNQKKLKK